MRIKYMGSADIREINKGTDAAGQLANKLPVDLVWDKSNNWVIDTDDEKYQGVDQEFWDLLIEGDESGKSFKDVSELKRIPPNEHQQIFMAMKGGEPNEDDAADSPEELAKHEAAASSGDTATDNAANESASEASPTAAANPVPGVGGSTKGKGKTS